MPAKPPQEPSEAAAPLPHKLNGTRRVEPAPAAALKPPKQLRLAPFKTAVIEAAPTDAFAPVLLELKNENSLRTIFTDLQRRFPGVLGDKTAELRPVAGPDNETWLALLAVPAVARDEAQAVCTAFGPEGKTLGCRVTRY